MVQYDPNVIHEHAQRLYDRATGIVVIYSIGSGLLGLIGGAALGSSLDFPGVIAVLSGVLLGAFGALAGQARGFELRLEAQTALCQVQIELNSRPHYASAYPPQGHPPHVS